MRLRTKFVLIFSGVVVTALAASMWLRAVKAHQTSAVPGIAQQVQVSGTPGSSSATTTIGGGQLPSPSPKFSGEIKESYLDSKPWWPPRVVPPKGAPNILLIMTDDQG